MAGRIARWATALTLSGYALIFLLWRGRQVSQIYSEPFVAALWRIFGGSWKGYFTPEGMNREFLAMLLVFLLITTLGAIAAAFLKQPLPSLARIPTVILFSLCGLIIFLSALSSTVSNFLHFNTLIEYGVRVYIPFLLLRHLLGDSWNKPRALMLLKVLLAVTFTAHGLYAMNVFPLPSNFLMMTSSILHTGREGSILFLLIVGILDIVASLAIFNKRTERMALTYMVIWGFLTATARLAAYYGTLDFTDYIIQWLPQFLIRSGHFLLPLYLLITIRTHKIPA